MELRILPGGKIKIETSGFYGSGCGDVVQKVRDALGQTIVEDDTKKPEFYEACAEPATVAEHQY